MLPCTLLVAFLLIGSSWAQNTNPNNLPPESRGVDFYVAFGWNYQPSYGQTRTLYISADIATTVVVATKTAILSTVNVPARSTISVNVSPVIVVKNTVQDMGIRVYSPTNTTFTLAGINTGTATTDAFLAYPLHVIGTSYVAAGYRGLDASSPGYMYAVAPFDGTTVTFTGPTALDGLSTTATFTLNAFQTVLVGISSGDITGFRLNSNKPVSFFGGAACTNIPLGVSACNVLVEMMPPTTTWEKEFLTVPLATRTAGDIIRVIAGAVATSVKVNGATVSNLAAYGFYEFSSTVANFIQTSEPAMVMQYCKGSSADGVSADPFQISVPPINQFSANYYITAPTGTYWTNYVNIVIQTGKQSGLTMDSAPISSSWTAIGATGYSYARLPIAGGNHWITHSSPIQPFEVISYGFGSYDGYGYIGGSRFAPLAIPCSTSTTVPGDGIDNDCDGKVDEEIRNGVDDDNDGRIDEDLAQDTCCYGKSGPVFSVTGSTANANIGCGDSLPAPATVTATVVCSSYTTVSVAPTVTTTAGSCPSGQTITRKWSLTDDCGRTTSISQVFTVISVCGNGVVEASEQCDGGSCCSSSCTLLSAGTTCRASNGVCDAAETCTGSSASCPADSFQASSVTCRASQGPCDAAETCTGSTASCPADSFIGAGTVCRASSGVCDISETCTGNSAACPADSFSPSSAVCRSSNGPCDVAEQCTGSTASCPADSFQASSVTCRASNGVCDVAEQCTGSSAACPADSFSPSTAVCRSSQGPCDVSEQCTGSDASCPADSFQSSSVTCRASSGICDISEQCTGSDAACPADSFVSSATTCRSSNGPCDVAEQCTGSDASCPADSFQASSVTCRASNGICDVAEQCTGSDASCPADSFEASSVTCRASNGICDVAEQCTGSDASCPVDSFVSSSTTCRASNGPCDVSEQCTGSDASCPADSFQSSAVTCRATAGPCDVEETCTGSDAACPVDSFQASSVSCRASAGVCDIAEQCTGSDAACPSDAVASSTTVCRDSIGPCDAAEMCTGSAVTCPADVSGSFETDCLGLTFVAPGQTTSFLNYEVISFNNFVGNTGAIEGRIAAKNNITAGWGWSAGSSIGRQTSDQVLTYSFVAGRSAQWNSGNLFPDQRNYAGAPTENAFVGDNNFVGDSSLAERVTGSCPTPGCLAQEFDDLRACYGAYQNALAAQTSNVQKFIEWSGLTLTCNSITDATYVVTIHPSEMSQYTYVTLNNCNANARWIVNIDTNDNVVMNGVTITTNSGAIVYNILGSGRTVSVGWIRVDGAIIAPYNTLQQTGGSIVGKVVFGDVIASQNILRGDCFTPY